MNNFNVTTRHGIATTLTKQNLSSPKKKKKCFDFNLNICSLFKRTLETKRINNYCYRNKGKLERYIWHTKETFSTVSNYKICKNIHFAKRKQNQVKTILQTKYKNSFRHKQSRLHKVFPTKVNSVFLLRGLQINMKNEYATAECLDTLEILKREERKTFNLICGVYFIHLVSNRVIHSVWTSFFWLFITVWVFGYTEKQTLSSIDFVNLIDSQVFWIDFGNKSDSIECNQRLPSLKF